MAGKRDKKGSKGGVIIKKYEIVEGGHHGGAWKVAYADFVTAMMAFFLLMWLLNATTEDQRKGLADYFSPNSLMSHASSGTGQPFGGHTAFDEGALVSDRGAVQIVTGKRPVLGSDRGWRRSRHTATPPRQEGEGVGQGPMADDQDADDEASASPWVRRARAARPVRVAADTRPGREGQPRTHWADSSLPPGRLWRRKRRARKKRRSNRRRSRSSKPWRAIPRWRICQATGDRYDPGRACASRSSTKSSFPCSRPDQSTPNERVRLLMQKVVPVLASLAQPISIAGHTDAPPFPGPDRTNWELSAERANATRRLLVDGGFPKTRIKSVIGDADRDPLLPADPLAAANRRIAILVLREAPSPASARQTSISASATALKPTQRGPSQPGSSQPNRSQTSSSQPSPSPSVASTN